MAPRTFHFTRFLSGLAVVGVALAGCQDSPQPQANQPEPYAPASPRYPVTLQYPAATPGVPTGLTDIHGRAITVACEVCHSLRADLPAPKTLGLESLDEFHQGLKLEHGSLTCYSCHNPENPQTFRLANGQEVEPWDTMELCSQCHGPQRKDYDHGAHGGMTGYWDLSQGPRTRNACTTCHAPHAPRPGQVHPTFKSRDRFLDGPHDDASNHAEVGDHE